MVTDLTTGLVRLSAMRDDLRAYEVQKLRFGNPRIGRRAYNEVEVDDAEATIAKMDRRA